MNEDSLQMPAKPFLSCEVDRFSLFDSSTLRTAADLAMLKPSLVLLVGPGNVLESRPIAASQSGLLTISIECEDQAQVILDLDAIAARKTTAAGEFLYGGGLDQGNEGLGWVAAR